MSEAGRESRYPPPAHPPPLAGVLSFSWISRGAEADEKWGEEEEERGGERRRKRRRRGRREGELG